MANSRNIMAHQKRIPKTFCTTREAAQILGVSLRTAQLWAESGLLEAWKTDGGHRRISRQSIERLLAEPGAQGVVGADEAAKLARVDTESSSPETRPLSILVAEDESTLRRMYELTLSRWSMQPRVRTAGDGYEALILIGHARPDLLITDLNMPGLDGFRMLQTLSAMPEMAGMKIVVVTGLDAAEIEAHGGVPEGVAVLPKPIPFVRLRELAESVLAARRAGESSSKSLALLSATTVAGSTIS